MTEYPEPRLEHLYDMHVDLAAPQVIGAAPAGHRQIFIVTGGSFEGPRIKGTIFPGGGDWALMRTDGAIQLDVRATVETDDGALIYAAYSGLIILSPEVLARIMGGENVPLSEYYFYTNPMFQTAAEDYAWLNETIAIGRGKVIPGGVEYRAWAVSDPA
ncbi:MAG TPA: DUF3237 domain-containing protein [Dehalococcoidia bacterium]